MFQMINLMINDCCSIFLAFAMTQSQFAPSPVWFFAPAWFTCGNYFGSCFPISTRLAPDSHELSTNVAPKRQIKYWTRKLQWTWVKQLFVTWFAWKWINSSHKTLSICQHASLCHPVIDFISHFIDSLFWLTQRDKFMHRNWNGHKWTIRTQIELFVGFVKREFFPTLEPFSWYISSLD